MVLLYEDGREVEADVFDLLSEQFTAYTAADRCEFRFYRDCGATWRIVT